MYSITFLLHRHQWGQRHHQRGQQPPPGSVPTLQHELSDIHRRHYFDDETGKTSGVRSHKHTQACLSVAELIYVSETLWLLSMAPGAEGARFPPALPTRPARRRRRRAAPKRHGTGVARIGNRCGPRTAQTCEFASARWCTNVDTNVKALYEYRYRRRSSLGDIPRLFASGYRQHLNAYVAVAPIDTRLLRLTPREKFPLDLTTFHRICLARRPGTCTEESY